MPYRYTPEKIFSGKPLLANDTTRFTADIPMDKKGWFALLLEISLGLVVGTGTGAKSEGELLITKNITFSTDIDKDSHNAPGRALWNYANFAKGVAPSKDAIAASDGTYKIVTPLLFQDPLAKVPHLSILDTRRYETVELAIQLGGLSDLLTSVGTAALTPTVTLSALKTNDVLPAKFRGPRFYPYFKAFPAVNHTDLQMKLPRIADLRVRRLMYELCTSASAGVPFSGTPNDVGITNLNIDKGDGYEFKGMTRSQLAGDNKEFYKIRPTGCYMVDFMPEGTANEPIITHPDILSKFELNWDTDTGTATTVNMLVDGVRQLKPVKAR